MSDSDNRNEPPGGEETSRKRPNANYRLSKETATGEGLVFHYNRERRLEKASQSVRDLYAPDPPKRFNLLRPLIAGKPRAMLFFSIMLMCAAILVLSIFGYASNSWELDGNRLTITALTYEDTVIVVIKKTIKKTLWNSPAAYTGAVNIAVSPAAAGGEPELPGVFYHRVFFTMDSPEDYRFSVPFDAAELVMVLQTETKTLRLTVKTE